MGIRSLLMLLTALALVACGRAAPTPAEPTRIPPGLAARFFPPDGWTWDRFETPDGAFRYGVAAPPVVPHADILVLPDRTLPAETWFETTRDLNQAGYTVWILDVSPAAGPGPVRTATAFMLDQVIGRSRRPLIVLGEGRGAAAALLARGEAAPADGVILSAPRLARSAGGAWGALAPMLTALGLGGLPVPFEDAWRRDGPDAFDRGVTGDRYRGALDQAWRIANPDLRPHVSFAALGVDAAIGRTAADSKLKAQAPVLLLASAPGGPAEAACRQAPACRVQVAKFGAAPHLAADPVRSAWMSAISEFVAEREHAVLARPSQAQARPLASPATK